MKLSISIGLHEANAFYNLLYNRQTLWSFTILGCVTSRPVLPTCTRTTDKVVSISSYLPALGRARRW